MFEQLAINIAKASEEMRKISAKICSQKNENTRVDVDSKTIRPMSRLRKTNDNVDENSLITQVSDIIGDAFK